MEIKGLSRKFCMRLLISQNTFKGKQAHKGRCGRPEGAEADRL